MAGLHHDSVFQIGRSRGLVQYGDDQFFLDDYADLVAGLDLIEVGSRRIDADRSLIALLVGQNHLAGCPIHLDNCGIEVQVDVLDSPRHALLIDHACMPLRVRGCLLGTIERAARGKGCAEQGNEF
ncbi:hypothetical protein D3C78_1443080 [compost metagenome]